MTKRQILKKVPAARCIYFGNHPNKKYVKNSVSITGIPECLGKKNQQKVSTVKVVLVLLTVPSLAVLINANESSGVKCVLHQQSLSELFLNSSKSSGRV